MIIRQMIANDIPELAQLYRQFWNEDSCIEIMYSQFKKVCDNGTHVLLSAIGNKKLIGSVMGVICEELYGNCKPFMVLENMIVDDEYRNKGVGRALIVELEKIAINKCCTQIILVTEVDRIDACQFYESVGYSPTKNKGYKKKL